MDIESFTSELFLALAQNGFFKQIFIEIDDEIVSGRIQFDDRRFLRFYFNTVTGVIAFALVGGESRLWGIDRDNLRGWHLHPADNPESHLPVNPLSVSEIIALLAEVLSSQA